MVTIESDLNLGLEVRPPTLFSTIAKFIRGC